MKYIRTYETKEKFLTDKDSVNRGFRLKPTLYKYSDVDNGIYLELDDPRKHGDSTWIRLEFTSATTFSFKISNVTGDDSNTLNYTIDWGDGTVETKTITAVQRNGLYTFTHSYAIGTYDMELYGTDRSYKLLGNDSSGSPYFSSPSAVRRVVLGDVVEIGSHTFHNCVKLTSINLPSVLTSIGVESFRNCSSLTSIHIPEGVTSIGGNAFYDCTKLTSINLPSTLTTISNGAFYNCTKLTSIHIPEGVTSIGAMVFYTCSRLNSIFSYNTTAPTLGTSVFTGMPRYGALYIKPGATGYDAWKSQLPSGWTIVEDL